jgi:deoxyribodipyrimidine photo-lyase
MTESQTILAWFRQDLRLSDNPMLVAASESGMCIVPVYILDDDSAGSWAMGAAARWWLHQSLTELNKGLGAGLRVYRGRADELIPRLAQEFGACGVFWNRCYEPWRVARDRKIESQLRASKLQVRTFNGSLLFEPEQVCKADGTPYRVFTPFYRKGCLQSGNAPRKPVSAPISVLPGRPTSANDIAGIGLLPEKRWYEEMARQWHPGEDGAKARLLSFLDGGIWNYKAGRDRPDEDYVSRLSPHLHFGEISPHEVWWAVKALEAEVGITADIDHFQSELGWREFSHNLLVHWPRLPEQNLQRKFDRFPWLDDEKSLQQWQRGETGYPIIDAGMRELWRTGYMHNRARMIVASFLVKNLMIHWHHGAAWFWDTLVDADLANNSASWQWVAGCGADAAPFFRIFNPVTQGQRFDPDGAYVRHFVPELSRLPNKFIHSPWLASPGILQHAGLRLGRDYPAPMVDLQKTRVRALDAFKSLNPPE